MDFFRPVLIVPINERKLISNISQDIISLLVVIPKRTEKKTKAVNMAFIFQEICLIINNKIVALIKGVPLR